jgi:hypothetical protein
MDASDNAQPCSALAVCSTRRVLDNAFEAIRLARDLWCNRPELYVCDPFGLSQVRRTVEDGAKRRPQGAKPQKAAPDPKDVNPEMRCHRTVSSLGRFLTVMHQ